MNAHAVSLICAMIGTSEQQAAYQAWAAYCNLAGISDPGQVDECTYGLYTVITRASLHGISQAELLEAVRGTPTGISPNYFVRYAGRDTSGTLVEGTASPGQLPATWSAVYPARNPWDGTQPTITDVSR